MRWFSSRAARRARRTVCQPPWSDKTQDGLPLRTKTGTRRHPGRELVYVVAAAALSLAAMVPGLDHSRASVSATRKVMEPAHGAYLGAFVNTPGTKRGGTLQVVLDSLPAFTEQIGRNLAIIQAYQSWSEPWVRNENLTIVADKYKAIPMVSWHCGDSNERIASGADDALIVKFAQQMKEYARPIFLRWYWEPNLPLYPACFGPGPETERASRYVAAFRRIARIFDQEGADNAAFVWSVSTITNPRVMKMYYPGDKYVDWIGADGYDRSHRGRAAFTEQFKPWYSRFARRGKPMIVTETGATIDQREFLQGAARAMPKDFPEIKGFIYFDSVGQTDWRLTSYGGVGIEAFAELGRDPYFAAMPET
jgi:hypothetical protein